MADGSLIFDTLLDISGIKSGMSKLGSITAKTAAAATKAIAAATSGISAGAAAAIKVGSNFESSMAQVAATMGITAQEIADGSEEFEKLKAAAKNAGETTMFSASQAAEALNYMALAGYTADEAIATMPTVLNLAAAGGMELATASDMVTDSMSALGEKAGTVESFVDKMAKTSQKSNTSVEQLGEAILTVGGTAKSLAGGVDEMNTVLGIFADNGVKGAEGGTALRNIILSLSAPTDVAAKAMESLGLEVFDTEGNMRPLNDTFNDLNAILSTMNAGEQTKVLSTIFNATDLKSVNALLANSGERFDELSGYISDCDGAAAAMAETMSDTLQGKLTLIQSALEGLGIQIYEGMQGTLREAANLGNDYIAMLAQGLKDGGVDGLVDALGTVIGDLVGHVTEMAPQMVKLAMGLLTSLGSALVENAPVILNSLLDVISVVAKSIGDACPALEPLISLLSTLAENMEVVLGIATPLIAAFVAWKAVLTISSLIQAVTAAMNGMTLAQYAASVAQGILNTTMLACPITWYAMGIAALVAIIIYLWNTCDWFREIWINLWESVKQFFIDAWDSLVVFCTETIPQLIADIGNWFSELPDKTKEVIDRVIEWFAKLPEKIAYQLAYTVTKTLLWAIEMRAKAKEAGKAFVENVINFIKELPSNVWNWFVTTVAKAAVFAVNLKMKASEAGRQFVEMLIDFVKNLPSRIWTWLTNTIIKVIAFAATMKEKAREAGKMFFDNIVDTLQNLPEKMGEIAGYIVAGLVNGIKNGMSSVVDSIKSMASSALQGVKDALGIHSPSRKFQYVGEMCVEGFDQPLEEYNPYATLKRSMEMGKGVMRMNYDAYITGADGKEAFDYTRMGKEMLYAFKRAELTVKIGGREFARLISEVL